MTVFIALQAGSKLAIRLNTKRKSRTGRGELQSCFHL